MAGFVAGIYIRYRVGDTTYRVCGKPNAFRSPGRVTSQQRVIFQETYQGDMLSELLQEEKRRLHDLELQLSEIERGITTIYTSDVKIGIQEMAPRLDALEKMAAKESKSFRADMLRRVDHLRKTYYHIKSSFENFERRQLHKNIDLQKQELFGNKTTRDPELVDLEMAENSSLGRSGAMMNEYIQSGRETLSELISQKERLKGVQTKVFDILNLLGISNTIMRSVEQRDYYDKLLVYGGMVVTLIIFVVVYFYMR